MHNFSYLRVMFALLIYYHTALHKGVTTALRATAVLVYSITHTHTHMYTPTHTFPLFCISETIGPIEPKFCMHMECDQTIKSHKNIKLIWGYLGYANEGQWRHNVLRSIEVKSHLTVIGFLPNFDML